MTKLEMKEAMDRGAVLVAKHGARAWYDPEHIYGPYVLQHDDRLESRFSGSWDWPYWEIERKPKRRPMTYAEAVAWAARHSIIYEARLVEGLTRWQPLWMYRYENPELYRVRPIGDTGEGEPLEVEE